MEQLVVYATIAHALIASSTHCSALVDSMKVVQFLVQGSDTKVQASDTHVYGCTLPVPTTPRLV
jgi:hypothetical protein